MAVGFSFENKPALTNLKFLCLHKPMPSGSGGTRDV